MKTEVKIKPCRQCGSTDIAPGCVRGGQWLCRACTNAKAREWHAKNRERARARSRAWYVKNRAHATAKAREWHAAHREYAVAAGRAWRVANTEYTRARDSARYAANTEYERARTRAYYAANTEHIRARQRDRNRSAVGVAATLRANHGFSDDDSVTLAKLLMHPDTRCSICGLPNRILTNERHRKWPSSLRSEKYRRHMECDHIDPNAPRDVIENCRPLCRECNVRRGATRLMDVEVWMRVSSWWREGYSLKNLWWLCTKGPGKGGRLWRATAQEKQAARFKAMRKCALPSAGAQ